jgi:long-chain acyl-CoA synthetase
MMAERANLATYLNDFARWPGETAYVYARGLRTYRMSYAELAQRAWGIARWLRETEGLADGARVILWGANTGEWVAAFWGCLAAGVVAVPLDAQASPDWVLRIAEETQASLLLHDEPECVLKPLRQERLATLAGLEGRAGERFEAATPITRTTLAQIIYTSGSTAQPKGVCLTHGNTLASLEPLEKEIARYLHWEKPFHPVRFLVQLPLSHVFGQMLGLFIPPLLRGEIHFLPELSPAEVTETIRRRKISVMATVPRYLDVLGAELRRGSEQHWGTEEFARRLGSSQKGRFLKRWWLFRDVHRRLGWKFWAFVCGGASLPEATEKFWHRLGYAVIQGYGMTETASLISVNHPFKMSRGSIGKSMPGREIRMGERGEILVRGQNVSPGYWTREGRVEPLAAEQGWFATGDLAEIDEAGNLFFRGRSKDVIVAANGMNIVPEDLEATLRAEPEVRDAAVVGVEGQNGQEPFALLLPAGKPGGAGGLGGGGALRDAVERANTRLEAHQRIARWAEWPEPDFPRTSTRKVQRARLREAAQAWVSGRSVEAVRADAIEEILVANGARWDSPPGDASQLGTDLGLDSLARVQVLAALEARFQVKLDEAAFTESTTLGEVRAMLAGELGGESVALEAGKTPGGAASGAALPRSERREAPYPFVRWPWFWWARTFRQAFQLLAMRPLTRFYSGWAPVEGAEHLRELHGPALYVANHLTSVDGALITGRLPWRFARRMAIAMSGEMLRGYKYPAPQEAWYWKVWLPVQYLLVVLVYAVFPLPRASGFRQAFQHAGRLADQGNSVLVFPEGTRSYTGEVLPFQHGIGILAKDLGLPVVPLRLKGIHELRERGRRVARHGEVRLSIGPPLRFDANADPGDIARRLEEAVRAL